MRSVAGYLPDVVRSMGPSARLMDLRDAWPSVVDIQLPSGATQRVYLHVSTVGWHNRLPYEYRFQNPANRQPVTSGPGGLPVLVGLHKVEGRVILVAADGRSRVDRVTRFSILFDIRITEEAARLGWASYRSATDENIYAMTPQLFPTFVELIRNGVEEDVSDAENRSIQAAVTASGLLDEDTLDASERARRAASVLIRNYAFGGQVVRAYGGMCAMCGLNTGLVVGAHIRPVAAQGSPDSIWNGLALCHNHHAAFDLHRIWVDPDSREINFHPTVLAEAARKPVLANFLERTFEELALPLDRVNSPRQQMFEERYAFFGERYDWVA